MKTVVVTGGAGFIGSHICDRLITKGFRVICIDNLITGRLENIKHLEGNNFKFIQHDITKPFHLDEKVDYIFHMASPASPIDYQLRPIETLEVGAIGTQNVLELARKNNARVVFSSTSEVYGDPIEHPQNESHWGNVNPVGPRSCYDESKRFAEALCMAYLRKHKMSIRIARIFNTYGPRMRLDDGRVVPNFVTQALTGKDITVYGDGNQTRSFCYVDDMVDGLFKLMFTEGIDGEVVNLGNSDERKIIEFANIVQSLTQSKAKITFHPLPKDDPTKRRPDTTKAKSLLNWEPNVHLHDGLKKTIEHFSNTLL